MPYFIKDFVNSRDEGKVILEESPVKSSGSNGVVERAFQLKKIKNKKFTILKKANSQFSGL